jgi:Uncharacterized conserved protein (COG2071)
MNLPQLQGVIERRLLVNYRADPDVVANYLPAPFRPQLVGGASVVGICLLRLGAMRPHRLPPWFGLRSENAAHRVAVEWDTPDGPRAGVYIPRRDSESLANVLIGGRLYPGEHERARFETDESGADLRVTFASVDGSVAVDAQVRIAEMLAGSELFADLDRASQFFERGADGYSATREPGRYDGLRLETRAWKVEPANVDHVRSSFFENTSVFPHGSVELDCALVMRDVPVVWHPLESVRATLGATSPA